jgi:porin
MQTTFSTGLGLKRANKDVAGIGLSWGKPADGLLRDQFTSEAFYRFQLTQFLAVTPDVQLIADPALNPSEEILAMFGIRVRAAF